MTRMGTPSDRPQDGARDASRGTRAWSKPVLIEYGHLAKLTRGPSGTQSEPTNFKKPPPMCL
jgi:hypothetical protein